MKKYQARKALSVLLALLMILTSVYAGLGVVASALAPSELKDEVTEQTPNPNLSGSKVYYVTQDTIISGSTTAPGMIVPQNTTVIIDVVEGATLTVKGGNASGATAGKAGIQLGTGSKLIITGSGNLVVIGGNGANGSAGSGANTSNNGGAGGAGGAGGGAGIGGNGGNGGAGGSGNNGNTGNKGSDGGSVSWPSNATVTIAIPSAKVAKTNGSNSNTGGTAGTNINSNTADGGPGGGGGSGYGAYAIGTGGPGGGGGGAGGKGGSHTEGSGCNAKEVNHWGNAGNGGKGAKDGNSNTAKNNNYGGAGGAAGNAGTGKEEYTYSTTDPFASMRTAISNNAGYYAKTMPELVTIEVATLTSVKSALETPYNALMTNYNTDIYNYYFGDYDTAALIQLLGEAIAMQDYIVLAQELQAFATTAFDTTASYSALEGLYTTYNTKYGTYQNLSDDTRAFLENNNYILPSAVGAQLASVQFYMDVANLRENYYDLITGDVATFSAYDSDWVAETDGVDELLSAAMTAVDSYRTTLNGLDQAAVKEVFGEGYVANTLTPLYTALDALTPYSEKKATFLGYKSTYDTALEPVNLNGSADYLYGILNNYDSWYTELQTFVAELREFDEDFADKVLSDLYTAMQTKINAVYTALNARVTTLIDDAYSFYQGFVETYGYKINSEDDINVTNYQQLKTMFNGISTAQYNFLKNTLNFEFPQPTQDKYEELEKAIFALENYEKTKGLSAYEFNNVVPVEDITRVVSEYDKVRNLDYTVDAEKRATAYESVKKLLNSDLLKGLLGGDDEEGGFSLDSLSDTLKTAIFSDSFVNTLISMIYPIVIDNFAPVWATQLPPDYEVTKSGFTFNFTIKPNLCTLRQALNKLGLYAMPNQLAAQPELEAYSEIKAKLAAVTYDPVYDADEEKVTVNPWNDPSLVDEDGKLALEWGVHDKDSFINALSAGLAGVAPILLALLSNKTTAKTVNIIGDGKKIQDSVLGGFVTVTIDPVNLNMTFNGNDGFNNALAPILSVLGAETIGDGNSMDTLRKLATGIATPLDEIINKLAEDPIDFLLKALPNLAFALEYGLITPLLANLKETITYSAVAHYTPSRCADPGDETAVQPTNISVDVGDILLGGLNLDFSTASGLVNSVINMLNKEEEPEPGSEPAEPAEPTGIAALLGALPIDELFEKIAYAGDSVIWKEGYRSVSPFTLVGNESDFPYIVSTPSEVFAYLVNYLLDLFSGDNTKLTALLTALGLEVNFDDENDMIAAILKKVLAAPDDAIAAIVELMAPVKYEAFKDYDDVTTDLSYGTPLDIAYLKYENTWTQAKAVAVLDGVDDIVKGFLDGKTLSEYLKGMLEGYLSADTVTSLATTLSGIGDLLGDMKDLVSQLTADIGVDLAVWGNAYGAVFAEDAEAGATGTLNGLTATKENGGIVWTVGDAALEDGDVQGFFGALSKLIAPLAPVLKIILTGEDLTLIDSAITIKGYECYENAILPILEALGIDPIENYETLSAADALDAIVAAVGEKAAALLNGNVAVNVLNLVPSLITFLDKNGISTALYNLLVPINVLIDTIRPIYDVDLMDLLGGLIGSDDTGSAEEPFLTLDDVLNGLTVKDLIEKVDAKFGTKLDGTPITTYMIPALYAIDKDMENKYDGDADREKKIAADVLTVILSGALEGLMAKSADETTDNAVVLLNALDQPDYVNYYNLAVKLLTGEEFSGDYMKINWGYMIGGGAEGTDWQLSTLALPEGNDNLYKSYVQYANDWNKNVAEYVDNNIDAIVADVLAAMGQSDLKTILSGLINDKLYTNGVRDAIAKALKSVVEMLKDFLGIADVLLETDLQNLDFNTLPDVTDKATFIAALDAMLSKLNSVLAFALFGEDYKFFYESGGDQTDMLVLGGGEAYNVALIPVLELLGCKPKAASEYLADGKYDAAAAMHDVLVALTDRIDVITEDPINELLNMLPNLLYFINADGVKAVVSNALAPFENVIRTVLPLVSPDNAPAEGEPLFEIVEGVSIDDLTTDNLLKILEDKTDLTLTNKQKEILKGFYLGTLTGYDSANGKRAFRMEYEVKPTGEGDETTLDRKDMITLLLGFVIDVLSTEDNRDAAEELLGENIAPIIFNILGMKKAVREKIEWMGVPDKVGEVFTAMDTTKEFSRNYGPLFTKEMAEYIAANLDTFLDNMVQLLGIPASTFDGLNLDIKSDSGFITSVEDLVNGLLEGTLYKAELVETIRGYILQAVDMINGLPASKHIKEVLKLAIGLDVDYYNKYYENGELQPIPEFDNSDPVNNPLRDQFVNALCDVLKPLYPLLQWLLSDRDISILYNSEGSDLITLFGFEGYRYGIAPIYEALGVNRPTQEEINGKETTEELLKAIINPLLDRLDEIIADPVNELFAILPEVAYFINTKGLDVSYKNLLAAVKTVLDAVDPLLPEDAKGKIAPIIAGQFGNLNITELTMQTLLDMVASNLGDGMDKLAFDAVAETTFGQLVSYDSELDYDAYKMQYVDEDSEADALTALLRLALRWIATGENGAKLKALVRENIEMSTEGYAYIDKLIDIVVAYAGTNSGMDSLLHMIYYIFYGIHNGSAAVAGWQKDYNTRLDAVAKGEEQASARDENLGKVAELLDWLYWFYGKDHEENPDPNDYGNVYHNYDNPDDDMSSPSAGKDNKGFAANGFIAFFRQIIEWFRTIFNKIFKH